MVLLLDKKNREALISPWINDSLINNYDIPKYEQSLNCNIKKFTRFVGFS